MKKIESSKCFLLENLNLFQCPVCGEEFREVKGNSLVCIQNHQFDLSKKGTLHLLSKGGQNEYDKEMLSSRKTLADSGFFQPLLDEIFQHINHPDTATILDVGCGEGSHLHYLTIKGLNGLKIGFDISKDAIQLAAAHFYEDAFWCVADLAHSPFAVEKFDVILNIFSPSHYQEFERLLKKEGKVIKVVPDAEYLIELREKVYESDQSKQVYENENVVNLFKKHYSNCIHKHVKYKVELTEETAKWLVEMTPLTWGASKESMDRIANNPLKSVTVAVSVLIGTKE